MNQFSVQTTINGIENTINVNDNTLLLDLLRSLGLTGAKPSCDMQVCGSCTVLIDGVPVSACTTLGVEVDGRNVETIEGLAKDGELHPLQQSFLDHFAYQCGYCTPGMIMSAKALIETNPNPSRDEIKHWLDGNICRCTGYDSIIAATQDAAAVMRCTNDEELSSAHE